MTVQFYEKDHVTVVDDDTATIGRARSRPSASISPADGNDCRTRSSPVVTHSPSATPDRAIDTSDFPDVDHVDLVSIVDFGNDVCRSTIRS